MIHSEILQEKDKTQTRLSEECTSIHDYLVKSRIAAEKAAESYGFTLKYAEEIHKIREEHFRLILINCQFIADTRVKAITIRGIW